MEFGILKEKRRDGAYESHMLSKPVMTVGRSKSADIIIEDSSVSRIHVRIELKGSAYYIFDNNSSNGTYVNRKKVQESVLRDGDDVVVGRVQFYFSHRNGAQEAASGVSETLETPRLQQQTAAMPVTAMGVPRQAGNPFEQDTPPGPMAAARARQPEAKQAPAPFPPPPPSPGYGPPAPPVPAATVSSPGFVPPPPTFTPPAPPSFAPPTFGIAPSPPSFSHSGEQGALTAATPIQRLLAVLLDGLIYTVLIGLQVVLLFLIPALATVVALLFPLAYLAYFFLALNRYGKTLGKHLLGLQIVQVDQPHVQGIPAKKVLMRMLGYVIFGWITLLFDPEGRGFHDKLSQCMVVKR
jgi:pSer/pThr/pTyr-binding forkhead associated (FHA) protein/uncharacterized RDD family membrane protein YckC